MCMLAALRIVLYRGTRSRTMLFTDVVDIISTSFQAPKRTELVSGENIHRAESVKGSFRNRPLTPTWLLRFFFAELPLPKISLAEIHHRSKHVRLSNRSPSATYSSEWLWKKNKFT
jgi:hypothetical protein